MATVQVARHSFSIPSPDSQRDDTLWRDSKKAGIYAMIAKTRKPIAGSSLNSSKDPNGVFSLPEKFDLLSLSACSSPKFYTSFEDSKRDRGRAYFGPLYPFCNHPERKSCHIGHSLLLGRSVRHHQT